MLSKRTKKRINFIKLDKIKFKKLQRKGFLHPCRVLYFNNKRTNFEIEDCYYIKVINDLTGPHDYSIIAGYTLIEITSGSKYLFKQNRLRNMSFKGTYPTLREAKDKAIELFTEKWLSG